MSLSANVFGDEKEQNEPQENDAQNAEELHNNHLHDNQLNDMNEEERQQPLYKIVQEVAMYGMREQDFYTLNSAVSHWESMTYLCAAVWYQWDSARNEWNIKDSYGTTKATKRICDYVDKCYHHHKAPPNADNMQRQSSIMTFLANLVSSDNEAPSHNEDDDDEDADDHKHNAQAQGDMNEHKEEQLAMKETDASSSASALMDEFWKWTETFTKKHGIKPVANLEVDDPECRDLVVSLVWSAGFQCYYIKSVVMAQQIWHSLGSWYASVWFTRNAMGTFVVHDTFGTSDSVTRICRFVNDAQETWNYKKHKDKVIERPLNENDDSVVIGNTEFGTTCMDEKKTDDGNGIDEDIEDSQCCIVCLDGIRDHILIPCGHICVCKVCKDLYNTKDATCPMCRSKVETVIKTFH